MKISPRYVLNGIMGVCIAGGIYATAKNLLDYVSVRYAVFNQQLARAGEITHDSIQAADKMAREAAMSCNNIGFIGAVSIGVIVASLLTFARKSDSEIEEKLRD